jgi:DNA-binding Lrp family transcriptional regulator
MQPGRRRQQVVEAFVLVQTEVGRAEVVAAELAGLPGVLSAEYVTGPYDVVVRVGGTSSDDLHSSIVPAVQHVQGITRTLTCPIAGVTHP